MPSRDLVISIIGDSSSVEKAFARTSASAGATATAVGKTSKAHDDAAKAATTHGKAVDKLGSAFKTAAISAGSFGLAFLSVEQVEKAAEATEELAHQTEILSTATGLGAKEASQFIELGKQWGISNTQVGTTFKTLSKQIAGAEKGTTSSKEAFEKLHIPLKELEGLSTFQTMEKISDAFEKMPAGAQKTALNTQLFGKSALALLPILDEGSKGLDEQLSKFEGLSKGQEKAAKEAMEVQRTISRAYDQLQIKVTFALLGAGKSVAGFIHQVEEGKTSIAKDIQAIGRYFSGAFEQELAGFEQYFKGFGQAIKGITEIISGAVHLEFGKMWSGIKNLFSGGVKEVEGILKVATAPLEGIARVMGTSLGGIFSDAWKTITGIFDSGANAVIGVIDTVIEGINAIPGIPNIGKIEPIGGSSVPQGIPKHQNPATVHRARGGSLANLGAPSGDTIPAMLERDEYVLNKNAVRAIGKGKLDHINFNVAPRFALGGALESIAGTVGEVVDAPVRIPAELAFGGAKSAASIISGFPSGKIGGVFAGLGPWIVEQAKDYLTGLPSSIFGGGGSGSSPAGGPGSLTGKVSWFNGGATAGGRNTSDPGIAMNLHPGTEGGWDNATTRGWMAESQAGHPHYAAVTIAGHSANLPIIDLGPAGFTDRAIDVTEGGVRKLGFTTADFPTDAVGVARYAAGGGVNLHGPPLFNGEGPPYYAAAFKHNQPWATHQAPWSTHLSASQESAFLQWGRNIDGKGHGFQWFGFDPRRAHNDYDMRGFWKETGGQGPAANGHFTDKWKTPYDTTFSNESKYAKRGTPFVWNRDYTWLYDRRSGQEIVSGKYAAGGSVGDAQHVIGWAQHHLGQGPRAGYSPGEWCGDFVGEDMIKHGIEPPSGYPVATNWMNFGTAGSPEYGNVVVIGGSGHVGLSLGGDQMIQGNFNNEVAVSSVSEAAGERPVLGYRKPPYVGGKSSTGSGGSRTVAKKPAKPKIGIGGGEAVEIPGLPRGTISGAGAGLPAAFRSQLAAPGLHFAERLGIGNEALSVAEESNDLTGEINAASYVLEIEKKNKVRIQKKLAKVLHELTKPQSPAQQKKLLAEANNLRQQLGEATSAIRGAQSTIKGAHESARESAKEAAENMTPAERAHETGWGGAIDEEGHIFEGGELGAFQFPQLEAKVEEVFKEIEDKQENEKTMREAIEALTASITEQTNLATSAIGTNSATAWKALSDILSGHLGARANLMAQTAGNGSLGTF